MVAKKPVTSFDVSPNGKLLALGGSDLSITVFDAETVQPLLSILKAHDFPSTCLRFSPDSELLISGSADNTLRIIRADQASHPTRHRGLQIALATLLVLLIAILVQFYAGDQVLAAIRRQTKGTDLTVQPTVQAIVPVPEGHVPDVYSTTSPANI